MNEPTIKPPRITAERLYVLSVLHDGTVLGQATRDAAEEIDRLNACISDATKDAADWKARFEGKVAYLRELQTLHDQERFRPLGDNHHNAVACPYCNPRREEFAPAGVVAYAVQQHDALERARGCIQGLLARTPVRDVSETLAEIDAALAKNPNPAGPQATAEASGPLSPEASGAGGAGTDVHTDHPLRHYDRTCPACVHETGKKSETPRTDAYLARDPDCCGLANLTRELERELNGALRRAQPGEERIRIETTVGGHLAVTLLPSGASALFRSTGEIGETIAHTLPTTFEAPINSRHQSCTQSPESIRPHFGWWDHFNEEFVRTPDDVVRRRAAGNKVTPLYIDCECVHQVNQLPPDVAAAMQAIDKTYGRSIKGGERAGYVMGSVPVHHLGTVLDYVRSLLVAGKKP